MNRQKTIKVLLFMTLFFNACALFAEKVPQSVVMSLYALTNQWGVTGGLQQYCQSRSSLEKQLQGYEDGSSILKDWRLRQIDLITSDISLDRSWLHEASSQLLMYSYSNMFRRSTNCWLSAAEFMGKIEARRATALKKWREIEGQPITEYGFYSDQVQKANLARNEYLDLDYIVAPVANAVTNVFPHNILPTLSEDTRAALYTNVLRRAGLVQ